MKALHLTYHAGCDRSIKYVAKKLNWQVETQYANWNYNISHNLAQEIWNIYKDFYNSFDLIIVSDTAPLARILLQNNFSKKIIIWVCNRFDYSDQATNKCSFPDKEYYKIFKDATRMSNVKIASYTEFEYLYAKKYKNIDIGDLTIKPCCFAENIDQVENNEKDYFFVPPYHNDTIFINLLDKCNSLGINCRSGRYNGPIELKNIKGMIHIPYAWSNLALFENLFLNNVYFIPSKKLIMEMSDKRNFFWSPPLDKELIEYSEWYNNENKNLFIYFDDWADLKVKTQNLELIKNTKRKIKEFVEVHNNKMINFWSKISQ